MPVPTIYRSTDVGAPTWGLSNSMQNRARYMLQILKACLVDGYSGKSPAGWSLVGHDDALPQLAMHNGPATGALRLTYQSNLVYASVYKVMSAIDAGVGGVSGDYLVASQGLRACGQAPAFAVSGGMRWVVVADARSFVMFWWAVTDWSAFKSDGWMAKYGQLFAGAADYGLSAPGLTAPNFLVGPWHWAGGAHSGALNAGWRDCVSVVGLPDGSDNAPAKPGRTPLAVGTSACAVQDYGAEVIIPLIVGQAAPAPGSTHLLTRERNVCRVRGVYHSLLIGDDYWQARLSSGDIEPGGVVTLFGRDMLVMTSVASGSTLMAFCSIDEADWP